MRQLLDFLHAAFHRPETRVHRVVSIAVWVLIALSVPLTVLELLVYDRRDLSGWILYADRAVLWCFVVELALRVLTYRPASIELFKAGPLGLLRTHLFGRLRFVFTPLILIDLLAVAALIPALRGLRVLRLLRLLRFTPLFRYSNPVLGIVRTFQENALLYVFAFGFLVTVVIVGGISMYLVEAQHPAPEVDSVANGIWWALVTLTTVGYGDLTPLTPLGRVVGGAVMALGMFTIALFAGIVGSTLLRVLFNLRQDQFRMSSYANHIVICGYDQAAPLLLDTVLAEIGDESTELVVFGRGERPMELPPEFIWISGDPSKEGELDKVRLSHARAAIVVASRQDSPSQADATTIMVLFTIRSYLEKNRDSARRNRPLYVVAEVLDPENDGHARTAGADEVIETTRLGYSMLAHAAFVPGSGTIMSQVASAGALSVYTAPNPFDTELAYGALLRRLRESHGVVVIGLRDPSSTEVLLSPDDGLQVGTDWEFVYLARAPVLRDGSTDDS